MIRVSGLSNSFGSKTVLRNISFALTAGEIVGVVGPSGGGKSVLLKVLGGILPADSGTIVLAESDGRPLHVGFLFQEGALFDSLTVLENVAFPLRVKRDRALHSQDESAHQATSDCTHKDAQQRAFEILKQVGLADAWRKIPGQLSGGMRRRVGLARALVLKPEILLLDDPTGGLDPVAASVIMNLIGEIHAQFQPTVVMVSHDIRRLLPRVSRVLGLFEGQIACDLPPNALIANASAPVLHFLKTRFNFEEISLPGADVEAHP